MGEKGGKMGQILKMDRRVLREKGTQVGKECRWLTVKSEEHKTMQITDR